jgi:hypothetical protein
MLQKTPSRPGAKKSFPLNDVLSVMSGLPLSDDGQIAVYRLVAFVMETEATACSAAANMETVKQCMQEQLPFLKDVDMSGLYQIYNYESNREEIENPYLDVWMEMQALRHGADHFLMPFSAWQNAKSAALAPKTKAAAAV